MLGKYVVMSTDVVLVPIKYQVLCIAPLTISFGDCQSTSWTVVVCGGAELVECHVCVARSDHRKLVWP